MARPMKTREPQGEEISAFDPKILQTSVEQSRVLKHRMAKKKKSAGYDTGGY